MDIGAINKQQFQPSGGAAYTPQKSDSVAIPSTQKSAVDNRTVKIAAVEEKTKIRSTENQRLQNIKEAIKIVFKDSYAVSDTSFSIFKDNNGQYITRVTSLRDGSVTYMPEPELLRQMEISGFDTSLLKVNV